MGDYEEEENEILEEEETSATEEDFGGFKPHPELVKLATWGSQRRKNK